MTFGTNIRRMAGRATALVAALGISAAVLPLLADATPQTLPVSQDWNNAALITVNDTWTGVPGFEGFRGDGLTGGTAVDPQTVLTADDLGVLDVNANQTNPNTFTTGGVTEFAISDPAIALTGSGTARAPYLRLTASTLGVTGVRVRYTLRDLDGSADNAVQPVALHYRVGTLGSWTNVPAAFVADATSGPSLATQTTAVDVTLPAAVDNQAVVQLRIMTTDAVGSDEWVGIDDIVVEAATAPTNPTITSATGTPSPVEHGQTLVITATAGAGSNPPSQTFSLTADVSTLGGVANLPLLDDGLGGDVVAGDRVFAARTLVTAAAGVGTRAIPITVTDEFARTGGGTLTVTVIAPIPTVTIAEIQGSGVASPLAGQVVRTRGVVTARKFNGLYLQSEPGTEDGNPATSDGIFVFTSSAPNAAFQPGDVVSAVATVVEFVPNADPLSPPLTELSFATLVEVGTAALPAPVAVTPALADPNGGLQQLEPLEGMLVSIASLTAVSGSDGNVNEPNNTGSNTGVFYTVLTGTPRPVREAGIPAMDPVLACAAGTGCTIPVFDQNPELLRVDADAILGVTAPVVTTGVVMTDVTAIVDYGFRSYTLLPTSPLLPSAPAAGVPARPRAAGEFTVASFNLQRLFDTVNDPAIGEPVVTATAYANRLIKISAAVRSYLHTPDILGVQEAENLTVLQDLAARIDADATAAGQPAPGYTAYLVEGNDVGGIDVGFLVTSRVTVQSVVQHGLNDTYTNPVSGLQDLLNDRPTLSIRATIAAEPGTLPAEVVAVVNHLRSLNGVEEADGRVRAKRLAQAEYVARLLDGLRASYPGVPVVSVGDYNAFEVNDGYVDVLGVVRGVPAPASDVVLFGADLLASDFLLAPVVAGTPADQTYSYVFEGSAQSLDHVLVSAEAAPSLAAFDHARINADFPEIYRGDATRVERISDHDPAIAYFRFPRDTTPPVVTVPANQQVTAQGPFGTLVSYTASATDGIDGSVTVSCAPASGSLFPYGATLVSCTASDAVGNVGTATFTVTVVDPATSGLIAGATVQGLGPAGTRVVFSAARTTGGQSGASVLATGRLASGAPALFVATGIGAVGFYNDPAASPGAWPASGIDTTRVVGTGWLNGVAGHTFELVAVDRGEPGRGRDGVELTVRNAQGVVVLQTTGVIVAGNVDSLPIW